MNSQAPISQEAKCRRTSYSFHCFYCNVKILEFQRNSKIFVTFTLKKILTFQLHRYTHTYLFIFYAVISYKNSLSNPSKVEGFQ